MQKLMLEYLTIVTFHIMFRWWKEAQVLGKILLLAKIMHHPLNKRLRKGATAVPPIGSLLQQHQKGWFKNSVLTFLVKLLKILIFNLEVFGSYLRNRITYRKISSHFGNLIVLAFKRGIRQMCGLRTSGIKN